MANYRSRSTDFEWNSKNIKKQICNRSFFLYRCFIFIFKKLKSQKRDEIISSAMTFCSVNVIEHAGATPVLVDIKLDSLNIDPDKIEQKLLKD